ASFMEDDQLARPFVDSLPTPGEGTLRNRFRNTQLDSIVRAKSGSIRGVRCLSGVVISPRTGRTVAFSILLNDVTSTAAIRAAKTYHEEVVDAIDDWLVETDTMFAAEDTETAPFGG
ncbi:MAG: D-alanyl-D-alanine carboxypeptidase, partial [Planctomycetota bacterium]